MKLPGTLEFGVQQLGRPDKGAMRDKAAAEGQAALAWGNALATAGTEFAKVASAESLADANLTLSERVSMDKKSTAELDAWLASNQSFNLISDSDTIPTAVKGAALKMGFKDQVDTYEIAIDASKMHFETAQKLSIAAMGEQSNSDQAVTSYNKQMDNVWASSASTSVKTHHIQRIQHLSARADLSYNEALNNLDEDEMAKIAVEAEQSGIWTPEYAGTKMAAIGSTVDKVAATRMYSDATTQGELDAADDFVDQSRIDPDSRMAMMKTSRQTAEFMYTQEMRKQPVNYGNAQALLIENKLTTGMVADMVRNQEISGAHANTLRNALNTPAPLTSTPIVVDRFTGKIALLRFSDPTADPDSVRARADKLRKEFQQAFTGMGANGEVLGRTLTGEDFAQLMQDLDKEVNTALGAGGRVDAIAMKQIQQITGYTDFIAEALGSNHPKAMAKADFERALIDYKDANPTGDAMEFVTRNQHLFIAEKYEQAYGDRLGQEFPQYAEDINAVVTGTPAKTTAVSAGVPVPAMTVAQLLFRARTDALNGVITEDAYQRLRRGLQYKYEATSGGARKTDE